MPIYEQTYRRYEARAPLRTVRFWPITREALRLILARRAFLGVVAPPFSSHVCLLRSHTVSPTVPGGYPA